MTNATDSAMTIQGFIAKDLLDSFPEEAMLDTVKKTIALNLNKKLKETRGTDAELTTEDVNWDVNHAEEGIYVDGSVPLA